MSCLGGCLCCANLLRPCAPRSAAPQTRKFNTCSYALQYSLRAPHLSPGVAGLGPAGGFNSRFGSGLTLGVGNTGGVRAAGAKRRLGDQA